MLEGVSVVHITHSHLSWIVIDIFARLYVMSEIINHPNEGRFMRALETWESATVYDL